MRDKKPSERPSDPDATPPRDEAERNPAKGFGEPPGRHPDATPETHVEGVPAPAGEPKSKRPDARKPPRGRPAPPRPVSENIAGPAADLPSLTNPKPNPNPDRPARPRKAPGQGPAKLPATDLSKDLAPLLRGWDYEPGAINVRKVAGLDGSPKLQMRLDLGLLQMELTGRPDGRRPHGCESLLDYHEAQLREHLARNGNDLGFHLTAPQCQSLRDEAMMYYHRYLSLFVLGEFPGVVRDTARNVRLLDLCGKFAVEEHDRLVLEQYRPYILMMHTRAAASLHYKARQYARALDTIHKGLEKIKAFFARFGHEEAYARCNEVKVLKRFAKEVRRKLPVDPVKRLQNRLERAVREERYEEAARLRDLIQAKRREKGATTPRPSDAPLTDGGSRTENGD